MRWSPTEIFHLVFIRYRVKSYEGTSSTGNVEITNIDVSSLHGKHVLFVEDIIDTGLTMSRLLAYLNDQIKPASIRYCTHPFLVLSGISANGLRVKAAIPSTVCNNHICVPFLFYLTFRVASLLEKRTHRSCGFKADYVGFSVPDE